MTESYFFLVILASRSIFFTVASSFSSKALSCSWSAFPWVSLLSVSCFLRIKSTVNCRSFTLSWIGFFFIWLALGVSPLSFSSVLLSVSFTGVPTLLPPLPFDLTWIFNLSILALTSLILFYISLSFFLMFYCIWSIRSCFFWFSSYRFAI